MAAIYRISEFKEEYIDHYPVPHTIPRMIFPKIGDHLKVSQTSSNIIGYLTLIVILL